MKSQKFIFISLLSATIILMVFWGFFIVQNSVNFPFSDQFSISVIISEPMNLGQILTYQNNEHRIGVPLLIMKVLADLSGWSQFWENGFLALLIILSFISLSAFKYSLTKKWELTDLVFPLLFFNIFQWENLIWGFQIHFILPLFFLCLWLWLLRVDNLRRRYFLMTFLSLLSAYSGLHGLILSILTLLIIIFDYFKSRTKNLKLSVVASLANVIIIGSYFIGFAKYFQGRISSSFLGIAEFVLFAFNSGFFCFLSNWLAFLVALVLATTTLYFLCFGLKKLLADNSDDKTLLSGTALILFALIFIGLITLGRSSVGPLGAQAPRYVTYLMLLPAGLYFISLSRPRGRQFRSVLIIFLLINSLSFVGYVLKAVPPITQNKREALACYLSSRPEDFYKCFLAFPLALDQEKVMKQFTKEEINDRALQLLRKKGYFR